MAASLIYRGNRLMGFFHHKAVGGTMTQTEFEATDGSTHVFASQATGDLLYASSATLATALAIGAANTVLRSTGTIPAWSSSSSSGSTVGILVENSDNSNAASHAHLQIKVGGSSGGDPYITLTGTGQDYYIGVDNSVSDELIIGRGTTLGTTRVVRITNGGHFLLNPDQASTNFTFASSGMTNILHVDGTNDLVGLGTTSATRFFNIQDKNDRSLTAEFKTVNFAAANTTLGGSYATQRDFHFSGRTYNSGAFTITTYSVLYVGQGSFSGGPAATTHYGIQVGSVTAGGGTRVGIGISDASTYTLWMTPNTDPTDAAGGITFGSSADTNLYRGAANVLQTDDNFTTRRTAAWANVRAQTFSSETSDSPAFIMETSRHNTLGSHTDMGNGERIGLYMFRGSAAGSFQTGGYIEMRTTEAWSSGSNLGGEMRFVTKENAEGGSEFIRMALKQNNHIEIQGGGEIQSASATEIGIQLTNSALAVGTAGSMVAPYLAQTGAAFTDGIGGDLDGAFGFNRDTDTGPTDTLEARVNGSWVSVSLSGTLLPARREYIEAKNGRRYDVHPNQVFESDSRRWVDERICLECGEALDFGDRAVLHINARRANGDLHAIYGHQHIEREPVFWDLKRQVVDLEAELETLKREKVAA